MSTIPDTWYVRFPDGRVMRADSTSAVRHQLGAGRIPMGSSVRRSRDEEWVSLEWSVEFSDVLKERQSLNKSDPLHAALSQQRGDRPPSGTIAARLDPVRLRTVGILGGLQELLAALDSALVARKLWLGLCAGLIAGLLVAVVRLPLIPWATLGGLSVAWVVAGVGIAIVAGIVAALLTQLTYVELSRLRPARWGEGVTGLGSSTLRLLFAVVPLVGSALGLLIVLQWLPGWLMNEERMAWGQWREVAAIAATVLAQLMAVAVWPLTAFALLLAPLLVVEGRSILSSWRQWFGLLRQHRGRALLFEMLAVTIAGAVCLPLLLPYFTLASLEPGVTDGARLAIAWTQHVLIGLALAPLFVYLVVANVFIYLNLRYEASGK